MSELGIQLETTDKDFISAAWRNLNLTAKTSIHFVGLVFGSLTGHTHCTLGSVLDLIQTLLFAIESLDTNHVEGIGQQIGLDRMV